MGKPRLFFGRIPGTLERRECPKCSVVWISSLLSRDRTKCIACRCPTRLLERIDSDGRLPLDAAKDELKALKEAYVAAHPKPRKRRARRAAA